MTVTSSPVRRAVTPGYIDPRGPRIGAMITTVVLFIALVATPSTVAIALVAWQSLCFLLGATRGVTATPYAALYRRFIRPRLAPPSELEDATPPRFAQGVGLAFAVVALVALLTGATLVAQIALGMALAAAFLNAAFGFCLGCEMYLLYRRAVGAR